MNTPVKAIIWPWLEPLFRRKSLNRFKVFPFRLKPNGVTLSRTLPALAAGKFATRIPTLNPKP